MKQFLRKHQDIIQTVIALMIAGTLISDMIGIPARLVMLLTVAASCFAAGINVGIFLQKKRKNRIQGHNE